MSGQDFLRQLPNSGVEFKQRRSFWRTIHVDPILLLLLLLLTGFGLYVLYSASGQDIGTVKKQAKFFTIAYVGMFFIAQLDLERIKRWTLLAYIGGIILLIAVPFFGVGAKGAQRWLSLGGFRFQPSELLKLVVPMMVAWYLSTQILPPRFKHIVISLFFIILPTLLIANQPDLGTSILIASSGLFVLFLSGVNWFYILGAFTAGAAAAYPMWEFGLREYQKQRILTMLDPESDKLGAGWNIIQSKTAIGSGGFDGKGWLHGTQSQLDFLPESHTDFIIAVIAEELGLVGVLMLMLIYIGIISRGIWIGLSASHGFGRLLAGSLILTFFIYIFVNMGMVSGLLPVVGVPLPLVSQGGTSIVTLMAGFGLLMAIGTESKMIKK